MSKDAESHFIANVNVLSWKNHKLGCVDAFLDNVDADDLDAGEEDDNAVANPVAKNRSTAL